MAREAWTDERLDELGNAMRTEFAELRADMRSMRAEIGEVRTEVGEVREGLGEVRADIKALNRTLQVGFGLIGSFLGVLTILIGTQL